MRILIFLGVVLVLVALGYQYLMIELISPGSSISISINGTNVTLSRTSSGTISIFSADKSSYLKGLGYAHAMDRGFQMYSWSIAGQGRLSEIFESTNSNLKLDIFSRQFGYAMDGNRTTKRLSPQTRQYLEDYAQGVNSYFADHGRSLEFVLAGIRPEKWRIDDTIIILRLLMIPRAQIEAEKFIIDTLFQYRSISIQRLLKRMFFPYLEQVKSNTFKKVRHLEHISRIPTGFDSVFPSLRYANHWAIVGNKSESRAPLMAFDTATDISQLPQMWYEMQNQMKGGDYVIGVTVPGIPFVFSGRNSKLSWSSSNGHGDTVDHFIEDCEGSSCKTGKDLMSIYKRGDWIKRLDKDPVKIYSFESSHGVLEVEDPSLDSLPKGLYLASASSHHEGGALSTLENMFRVDSATSIVEMQSIVQNLSISLNFLMADKSGNVGYQQTGTIPYRRHSGMYPLIGWDPKSNWNGWIPPKDLTSLSNPYFGTLSTANDDWNTEGNPLTINLHSGSYRRDRIDALLRRKTSFTADDMKRIQQDTLSVQAIRFMKVISPHLSKKDSNATATLLSWDFKYTYGSAGAYIFDSMRREILNDIFGRILDLEKLEKSFLYQEYPHYFDTIFFEYHKQLDKLLWKGETRAEFIIRVVKPHLQKIKVKPYGKRVHLINTLWSKLMPNWIGFMFGIHKPIEQQGSSSTLTMGNLRQSLYVATSYRSVVDMSNNEIETCHAGGARESIFSRIYLSDFDNYRSSKYKTLKP